jgi:cell division protein FtsA
MDRMLAAIDVGTTKICTVVAEVGEGGQLHVAGMGLVPAQGMRKGMVVNVEEAARAIALSVDQAERSSGLPIDQAFVGVTGEHIASINGRGFVAITHSDRVITPEDVRRALEATQAIAVPHNRKILHVIPRGYILDGQDGIREPVGMQAYRLEAEAHIVTAAIASLQNLVRCVERADIEIQDLVLEPLASAEAILTTSEQEMGVVLADIGGGTTDVGVFTEGSIWHSSVLPVGGNLLTNDVAMVLRTPFTAAETLKIQHGHVFLNGSGQDSTIELAAFGDEPPQAISRNFLSEVLQARAVELLQLIRQEIQRTGQESLLPAGAVLCGGSAQLPGLKELARVVLGMPVRLGHPRGLDGLIDQLDSPAFATAAGLLLWGQRHGSSLNQAARRNGRHPDPVSRFLNWVRQAFFPR